MLANTGGTQREKKRFCPQTSVYNKFCKINSVKEIAKGSTVQNFVSSGSVELILEKELI